MLLVFGLSMDLLCFVYSEIGICVCIMDICFIIHTIRLAASLPSCV